MDLGAYSDQATYKEFSPKTVPIPTGRLIESSGRLISL